jgi:hypothetical protein
MLREPCNLDSCNIAYLSNGDFEIMHADWFKNTVTLKGVSSSASCSLNGEGYLDKKVTSYDDSFDSFRLSLRLPVTTVDIFSLLRIIEYRDSSNK